MKKIVESNADVIERVMGYNLKNIIDKRHEMAFKLNMRFRSEIKMMKKGNKILVGYFDSHHNLDGICCKLSIN